MTIKINATDWNNLSKEDQGKIQKIIADNFDGQSVSAGDDVGVTSNPNCIAACNIAETAALQACDGLGFPANMVCAAAAHQAGDFCRSRC